VSAYNFGNSVSNLTKLFHVTESTRDKLGTTVARPFPKIWEGKKRPKYRAIFGNFRFDRKYLRNGTT